MDLRGPRRGVVLILVLGVLTLLSLLAATFASLASVERDVSRNHLDAVRARLLAQSGVETAIARLRGIASLGGFLDDLSWAPGEPGRPSFALGVRPRIGGREHEISGTLETGTYGRHGDLFILRVTDENARINVNDGVPYGPGHSVSRNLGRILNILGAQPTVQVPNLGDRILAARPPGGYATTADVARALGFDRDLWGRVRDFLTVRSWSDPHVCEPVPLSSVAAACHPVAFHRPGGIYRYGHQRDARGRLIRNPLRAWDPAVADPFHHALWGRDSLHPQWIEIVTRSPVNVNTARREVLMALLTDLEGVFLVERRREVRGGYAWADTRYGYGGSGPEGDECGFLYRTLPFTGPGGRSRHGIPAEAVVDEILACRARRPSPRIPGLDYARVPFGGPFRSWAQFHLFADRLVQEGLLRETRVDLFRDLDETGRPAGVSPLQLRLASQAIADVLKANFNPNLHLNELNPNLNLFTHVDKTDLVVHSTEFCFAPMGVFEIESRGILARPREGEDVLSAPDSEAVASQGVTVRVRLFDALRETAQAHFAAGTFAPRRGGPETNSTWSLEAGPEPDNGPAPLENRHEGYLQLPTLGGNLFDPDLHKPKGALWTTLSDPSFYPGACPSAAPGTGQLGSLIHAHFQFDHAAHHHANRSPRAWPRNWDGYRLPQGAWTAETSRRCCLNRNWEDRTELLSPPYGPVDSPRVEGPPHRYRLGRSFSLLEGEPEAFEAAPSDLRLDGAYVERHSAFGYWIEENVSFNFNEGTAAFWMKPAFSPAMTGKSRVLLSFSRYHAHARDVLNPSPFALFFVPGSAVVEGPGPLYGGGLFRPASLAFGFGFSSDTGYNWEMTGSDGPAGGAAETHATSHAFAFTPTLGRGGSEEGGAKRDVLGAHEWVHLAVTWSNPRDRIPDASTVQIYVNGRILPGSTGLPHLYGPEHGRGQPFSRTPRWAIHSLQALLSGRTVPKWCVNTVRIGGEPSVLFDGVLAEVFPRNFSADATFDEFYLWGDRRTHAGGGLAGAQLLWARGRYYKPDDADPADAFFLSPPLSFPEAPRRVLPPPSGPVEGSPVPPAAGVRRLLGLSWTEYAEGYGRSGTRMDPFLRDYSVDPPAELRPAEGNVADLWVRVGETSYGPFRDPGYSAARAAGGGPLEIPPGAEVRYGVKLKMGSPASPATVLLATPVLDDVTLYFESGGPEILEWLPLGGGG